MDHYVDPDRLALDAMEGPIAVGRVKALRAYVALLRPRHWIKNVLVLLVPVTAGPREAIPHLAAIGLILLAFMSASSAVYILNDLRDCEADRLHPVKRLRPLASGRVSVRGALVALTALLLTTVGLLIAVPPLGSLVLGGYIAMNIWYTLSLKHQPLVDVSVVAAGFVLRVLAGALAAGLTIQPLLLICVYCASVALSLGKRRHELVDLKVTGEKHRPALAAYTVSFLDHVVVVNLVAALMCYVATMWQLQAPYGKVGAALSFPFAAFHVTRYLQMLIVERSGGDPVEDLMRDRQMRLNLGLWTAVLASTFLASFL
ncbi:UbiA family prenyltransferase [Streptomyces scabiei]|uniref:UbiA family prenyltransferase n=1 Tax=Streptomyces scabiei TaxID=1930 RepID=UPI0029AFBF5A|nr:UbiA family prenyltransferase [Streptomyces scabiei]MDX3524575.1 UbiA family prenyltransferase [Streptomyces scabiei]